MCVRACPTVTCAQSEHNQDLSPLECYTASTDKYSPFRRRVLSSKYLSTLFNYAPKNKERHSINTEFAAEPL